MFSFFATGLEFTFTRDAIAHNGARTVCGVLTCKETVSSSDSVNSEYDQKPSTVFFRNISSLSIFRTVSSGSKNKNSEDREVLIASVTSENPKITRVASSVKVDGVLEEGWATIRSELFKDNDCQSEFTCQVRGLDSQGREAVSTTSLLQQPSQRGNLGYDGGLMPAMSLQLLTSIQQLVTQSVAGLENKIESVEQRLVDQIKSNENKLDSVEQRLTDKLESVKDEVDDFKQRLEHKMEATKDGIDQKINQLENRMEDKIDNNNNLNKLIQLDVKVSTELAQFRSDARADIVDSLNILGLRLGGEQRMAMRNVTDGLEITLEKTVSRLSSLESDLNGIQTCGQNELLTLKTQTEILQGLVKSGDDAMRDMGKDILISNQELLKNFRELESVIHNYSSTETRTELYDFLSGSELKTLKDLTTKSCQRRSGFIPTTDPSPYVLINPEDQTIGGLDFPHLCDVVKEGGGWIIIQRRSTGNVDFNRKWYDYKNGFGSFYDDFWLGNEKIHTITENGTYELEINLRYKDKTGYAHYADFSVGDEDTNYTLSIGSFYGSAGDSMSYHNGRQFSTIDRDNDASNANCARDHGGGWWFGGCDNSNLNGNWGLRKDLGVEWTKFAGADSVSYSEMKVRQVTF